MFLHKEQETTLEHVLLAGLSYHHVAGHHQVWLLCIYCEVLCCRYIHSMFTSPFPFILLHSSHSTHSLPCTPLHLLHSLSNVLKCSGPSMCPTLNPAGDIVLVNKTCSTFKVGDVVIAASPSHRHKTVCKRIAAMVCNFSPPLLTSHSPPLFPFFLFLSAYPHSCSRRETEC